MKVSGEEKSSLSDKYTFDALTNKGDLLIVDLPYVSEDESTKYKSNTITFGKEMRDLASSFNNSKNTATSTYLFCPDLNHDVLITRQSFKHGAERIDNAYIAICKSARNILENSIVVNEIVERANTSGGYVLLGIAQNNENYVIIRSVINKKTWKLDEYEELSAIRKKSIKKEDVGFKPPQYIHKNGYETSSVISIADFLENVKNIPLVNEVFSMDVAEKLGANRSKGTLSGSLRYSLSDTEQREELARAFEGLAKTEAERDIVNAYRKEINKIGERIEQREKLIIRLQELEGRRGFAGERSELRVRISELT